MYAASVNTLVPSYPATSDGQSEQTIDHPSCVWDAAFLPCGDLITACADGAFRIWTKDAGRMAPEDLQTSYKERVAATKK